MWFRTHGGRLIHAVGGLASVCADRGWEQVDDDAAAGEVSSGAAQARADVEAEAATQVDHTTTQQQATAQAASQAGGPTLRATMGHDQLTPEDNAMVDQAIRDETTGAQRGQTQGDPGEGVDG